jgi:hypothetical protein
MTAFRVRPILAAFLFFGPLPLAHEEECRLPSVSAVPRDFRRQRRVDLQPASALRL